MLAAEATARQPMLFLVNLEAAVERRERMLRQLAAADLAAHRVGVDLRLRGLDELRDELAALLPRVQFDLRRLGGAELGCWASHLTAWLKLLEGGEPSATVIEDDVVLSLAFREALRSLHGSNVFDIVHLAPNGGWTAAPRQQAPGQPAIRPTTGRRLTHRAYTIRRGFAERFFAQRWAVVDVPLDHLLGARTDWARPSIGALRPTVIWGDRHLARQSPLRQPGSRWVRSLLGEASRAGRTTR